MGGANIIIMTLSEKEEKRSWSDAPLDVLSLIRSHLFAGDAAAFSAVCKTWKSVPAVARQTNIPPPINTNTNDEESIFFSFPCLMLSNGRFFHPLYNSFFQMADTIAGLPEGIIRATAAKSGWLLMTRGNASAFFFNAFTNQRKDLPRGPRYPLRFVTFSSPPTSPDCEVVSLREDIEDVIVVETMKRGEEDFETRHEFRGRGIFQLAQCNPVFYRGEYYCMGDSGNLVIYNSKRNKHRLTGSPRHLWRHFSAVDCRHFMFEGEGDLWAVFVACQGRKVCVFRLNVADMVWEMVHDLEDRMVFLSHAGSVMERARVRGAGNKIYFPKFRGNNSSLFYSLATKRYHTYDHGGTSCHNFHNSKEMLRCTWIKIHDPHHQPVEATTCACGEEDEFSW